MMRNAFMCMEKDPRKETGMTSRAVWLQKMETLIPPQLFFVKKQSVEAIEECHADYCAWSTRSRPLTTVAIHGFRFGIYHVVVPLYFLRSSFTFSLVLYFYCLMISPFLCNIPSAQSRILIGSCIRSTTILVVPWELEILLYAGDLIIISRSKAGLQIKTVSMLWPSTADHWCKRKSKLNQLWIFNDERNKDCNFYISNEKIDIVQNYTHPGTQIS